MVWNWSNIIVDQWLIFNDPTIPLEANRLTIPNIPPNPPLYIIPNSPNRLPKVRTTSGWQLMWQILMVHEIFRKQRLRPQTFWIDN